MQHNDATRKYILDVKLKNRSPSTPHHSWISKGTTSHALRFIFKCSLPALQLTPRMPDNYIIFDIIGIPDVTQTRPYDTLAQLEIASEKYQLQLLDNQRICWLPSRKPLAFVFWCNEFSKTSKHLLCLPIDSYPKDKLFKCFVYTGQSIKKYLTDRIIALVKNNKAFYSGEASFLSKFSFHHFFFNCCSVYDKNQHIL